ncbi:hypothetical protein Vretifemale_6756 [Volvox reticuliferus]|uniref:Uncharacterized protein n=1 Tax=Volvox reticuliferus TaxID=1737510 RepID=A0A8J4FI43_9CHLO|nr:hypothetical protein Vretifemale_6756 [Volvox reticuliferus]
MQPTEQSRQQLRCALRDLGARAEKFNEEDLNNLLRERYQTLDDLREARANSLRAAGLPLALVDHTVAVQRASAAGLGVRSAAGAGAAAGVGTTRAGEWGDAQRVAAGHDTLPLRGWPLDSGGAQCGWGQTSALFDG